MPLPGNNLRDNEFMRPVAPQLEELARALYEATDQPRPTWHQLGEVTRSVWLEYAENKLRGIKNWWSVEHNRHFVPNVGRVVRRIMEKMEMSELNLKKLAEQFSELAAVAEAIGATFLGGGGGGKVPAGKKAAGKRPAKDVEPEGEEIDINTVREKLKELVEAKGKEVMVQALEHVGAGKLADVDEDQYQELMDKAQELIDEEEEEEEEEEKPAKKKVAAKKTAPAKKTAKKKGPTLETVQEAAEALKDADAKAYRKILKALGALDELDEGDYQDAIDQFEAAMPE